MEPNYATFFTLHSIDLNRKLARVRLIIKIVIDYNINDEEKNVKKLAGGDFKS